MSKPDDWDLAFATAPRFAYLLVQRLEELEKRVKDLEDRSELIEATMLDPIPKVDGADLLEPSSD